MTLSKPTYAVLVAAILSLGTPAHAGLIDNLFGQQARPGGARLKWGEFDAVSLVPAEAGAAVNQPWPVVSNEALRRLLGSLQLPGEKALFDESQLAPLANALNHALKQAGSGHDVAFFVTARPGGALLAPLHSTSGRFFYSGGKLNLIVGDVEFDFYSRYRLSGQMPKVSYGSRQGASSAVLSLAEQAAAPHARPDRRDWLELTLPATPAPAVQTGAVAPDAPAQPVAPAAPYQDQENRLIGLKRLLDKGLIDEREYREKRAEILKTL